MNRLFSPIQVLGMVVVGAAMLLCYGIMPYIGAGILIFFDYAAYGFRWLGAGIPVVAWALLGAGIGGLVALNRSFRRFGMLRLSPKVVLWGASGFACLYVMSFVYCHVMKPVPPAAPVAVTTTVITAP